MTHSRAVVERPIGDIRAITTLTCPPYHPVRNWTEAIRYGPDVMRCRAQGISRYLETLNGAKSLPLPFNQRACPGLGGGGLIWRKIFSDLILKANPQRDFPNSGGRLRAHPIGGRSKILEHRNYGEAVFADRDPFGDPSPFVIAQNWDELVGQL